MKCTKIKCLQNILNLQYIVSIINSPANCSFMTDNNSYCCIDHTLKLDGELAILVDNRFKLYTSKHLDQTSVDA